MALRPPADEGQPLLGPAVPPSSTACAARVQRRGQRHRAGPRRPSSGSPRTAPAHPGRCRRRPGSISAVTPSPPVPATPGIVRATLLQHRARPSAGIRGRGTCAPRRAASAASSEKSKFMRGQRCHGPGRAAVEGLPLGRHLRPQQGGGAQVLAEQIGQPVGLSHEGRQADAVDEAERPAGGAGRIAHAEDQARCRRRRATAARPPSIAALPPRAPARTGMRCFRSCGRAVPPWRGYKPGQTRPQPLAPALAGQVVVVEALAVLLAQAAQVVEPRAPAPSGLPCRRSGNSSSAPGRRAPRARSTARR